MTNYFLNLLDLSGRISYFIGLILVGSFHTNAQEFVFGTGGGANDEGTAIDMDQYGNIYCAGTLGWPAVYDGVNLGQVSGFLAKHDSTGSVNWVKGLYSILPYDIAVDDMGNTYLTGAFIGTIVLGAVDTFISNGHYDVLVIKYDSSGSYQWAWAWGSSRSSEIDHAESIVLGKDGVFITGNNGGQYFTAKLGLNGVLHWLDHGVSAFRSQGYGNTIDSTGNLWVTGFLAGILYLKDDTLYSPSPRNPFIAKYDSTGTLTNHHIVSDTVSYKDITSIKALENGVIVIAHNSSLTGLTAMVRRYDNSIAEVWTLNFGDSVLNESPINLAIDDDHAYVTGFWGQKLVPGVGFLYKQIFIATIALNKGELINNYVFGDTISPPIAYNQHGHDIKVDERYIYITGTFKGILNTLSGTVSTTGYGDVFIGKFSKFNFINTESTRKLEGSIELYPVPCYGVIYVKCEFLPKKITLLDLSGKIIAQSSYTNQIQIPDSVKGFMILLLESTEMVYTKKVLCR